MPIEPAAAPIEAALERITAIRQAMANPSMLVGGGIDGITGGSEAPSAGSAASTSSFASALAQATQSAGTAGTLDAADDQGLSGVASPSYAYGLTGVQGASAPGLQNTGSGNQMVAIAESQIGQAEQPPGSNEGPAIAMYRSATAGAAPGEPWCAYFASWVARQAGEPIGEGGQGLGSVSAIWSWAQSTGRAEVNGPGVTPKPGDLIVFGGEHVGIVRDVLPNGEIQTIEGNYENKVAANVRSPTEATGYVSMS
jgi:CHAP domain